MTIDKSWIRLRNRNSDEFWDGLQAFLLRCKSYLNEYGKCRCPCNNCGNVEYGTISEMEAHIHRYGFSSTYTTWWYHGENPVPPTVQSVDEETDGLQDVINDIRQENICNEPTEGSSATNEDLRVANDEIDDLIKLLDTQLYPGCDWMSSFEFLSKMLHLKVMNKWSNTSFDQLLSFLKDAFPKDNKIPKSYYEAKKKMKGVGLGYENIHVCINDCCLFWDEYKELQSCPVCHESRWKDKDTNGKKVANKILRYFPLTPRLKRLYSSRHTAKHMTWHATEKCTDDGKMRHPVDGTTWKDFDERYPDFARDARNVRLGLSADGFNPNGNMSLSYSVWPVILTTYNMPPWLCMQESSFMLTLLIPGPRSPGKDMDIFLRPLVDELKSLWSKGEPTMDTATNTVFNMRAMLLWTINDYPARSSLSGWSGQGYYACPTCNVDTPYFPVKGKTVYIGHRRFLPMTHHWRKSKKFNGQIERKPAPRKFTNEDIQAQLNNVRKRKPGKHESHGLSKENMKKCKDKELNWTKRSIFFELEYWSSIQLKHNLDVMHVEKNVCESLLGTLLMNGKSKDTVNARKDLEKMNIRPELWLQEKGPDKYLKPHPKYSFTTANREKFCKFIKEVKLPDGFGSNFKQKVNQNNDITGLKSHDYHIMMQRLMSVGVQAYLDKSISTPIIELCSFFKQLCARNLMKSDMIEAREKLIKILCTFEQIFPPAFFDIMIHLVMHLPEEAIQGGPVYMRWMYPFERYMKKLNNYVRNKARPEGSIAEGYIADEALTFFSRYLHGVQTRFNRPDRNEDTPTITREYYVFQSACTPISKGIETQLDHDSQKRAEWFVLHNSPEIDNYRNEFSTINPNSNQQMNFPMWFKTKINQLHVSNRSSCNDELLALANGALLTKSYTACIVNGVRFVVHNRDRKRTTQNSGVSTPGSDGTTYYGLLEDILELNYLHGCKVVLFRCKWYKSDNAHCITKNNITRIDTNVEWYQEEQLILASQVCQVFYLQDPSRGRNWKVIQEANYRKIWDQDIVEDNTDDVVHQNNSNDIALSSNLDDLNYTGLSEGDAMEVEVEEENADARIAFDMDMSDDSEYE